jgi:hypothetical protein
MQFVVDLGRLAEIAKITGYGSVRSTHSRDRCHIIESPMQEFAPGFTEK